MKWSPWLIIPCLAGGCASERIARDLAKQTLVTLTHYEKQVGEKIEAERQFYSAQLSNIERSLGPGADLNGSADISNTWLYGSIASSIARDARTAAGEIVTEPEGKTLGIMMEHLARGIDQDRTSVLEMRRRQTTLEAAFLQGIRTLEIEQTKLESMRKNLTALSEKPSLKIRLAQAQAYGKVIEEVIKSAEQEKDGAAKPQ